MSGHDDRPLGGISLAIGAELVVVMAIFVAAGVAVHGAEIYAAFLEWLS